MAKTHLILASGSPRRRALLAQLGLEFEVAVPDVAEDRFPGEQPAVYVERVAREKATSVGVTDAVVLAADTAVVHRGRVMGKPGHPAEAISMLERLADDSHTVLTGVAVAFPGAAGVEMVSACSATVVRFAAITSEEIAAYVATGEPMDKAGAYALQGIGGMFVKSISGSPSNVVGLPLEVSARLLRAAGIEIL